MPNLKTILRECNDWGIILILILILPLRILFWHGPRALATLLFHVIVSAQDILSEYGRKRDFGNNTRNAATRLPHEVQLEIFGVIARIKDLHSERGRPWGSAGSLARIALVCRSWHGCATQQLYSDIHLPTERACVRLAASLARRPPLTPFILRLTFPQSISVLPMLPIELVRRYTLLEEGYFTFREVPWYDLKVAVDEIIQRCSACHSIHFGIDSGGSHLRVYLPRLGRLRCLSIKGRRVAFSDDHACAIDFPAADLHHSLATLTSICIARCKIFYGSSVMLPSLISLTLEDCKLHIDWLASVTSQFPNLQHYHLIDNEFFPLTPGAKIRVVPERHILKSFTLTKPFFMSGPVSFPNTEFLCHVSIYADLLWGCYVLPPNIEVLELIPFQYAALDRSIVFNMVVKIKGHLREWKRNSPKLHTLRMYVDEVSNWRSQLETWKVVAVMLGSFCGVRGVRFDLSLRLAPSICQRVYSNRARDWMKRRLLWQDVL
ncbi:hypothetical protein EXIGLDRAFT_829518 [Exidia glandulosa HHB12029]|uniref:F-box domain-containing protein n=1 Tax=Exidia glandulosa HHB12029 TaxID=1314781 RepID=A0A165PBJ4_EXIGL|nr:hypothetical protein EXIGLDRAFT_829518 [Exidia glandulosa HHB12029]